MVFKKSPYIIFNEDFSITNLLTEKRLHLNGGKGRSFYNRIKELPIDFCDNLIKKNDLDVQFLLDKKYVFNSEIDPIRISLIKYASIEINTHCNSRCKFCPVSVSPLKKQFIADDLFETILQQLQGFNTIRWVSLNHYNEPLLDPSLYSKILLMKDYGLKVRLFTNGKNLDPSFFKQELVDNLDVLVINLPTIEDQRYLEYTGTKMPEDLLSNIRDIINIGFPIEISINGQKHIAEVNKEEINKYFELDKYRNCHSYINVTNTRSGQINNDYVNVDKKHEGKLMGCRRFAENLTISKDGDVFICCQDYFQKYKVGNVKENSITEIISSKPYLDLKKKIFGLLPAESKFICRYCNELMHDK